MQSGIPLEEGIGMLLEEEHDSIAADELKKIQDAMRAGAPLYEALTQTEHFPPYLMEMVKIGEKTGSLDRVLRSLSRHYEHQAETRQSLQNAVLYPAVLTGMLLVVIVILVTKVLPIFDDVYRQLGATMSGAASAILRFGQALCAYWLPVVAVIAGLLLAALAAARLSQGQRFLRNLLLPKRLRRLIVEERFATAMAMTVASGFDVDEALAMSADLCGDEEMTKEISDCRNQMAGGTTFSEAVTNSKVLQGLPARMLAVGFRTGAADTVLMDIAERTQRRILEETDNLIGRIEPTLVIIMSVLVGIILLAVMLPLMGVLSTLG